MFVYSNVIQKLLNFKVFVTYENTLGYMFVIYKTIVLSLDGSLC